MSKTDLKRLERSRLRGSLTVEAAYTISIVLISMGIIIKLCFVNHDRSLANAVLNEALELYTHEIDEDTEELGSYASERLSSLLSQNSFEINLTVHDDRIEGVVSGNGYTKTMSERAFEPHKLMRRMTLLDGLKDDGN